MQLLMSPASPYVRKTRVTIRELGLTGQIEEIALSTNALDTDPRLASANPAGKIPALTRDDGPTVHDSRVICRYLDHLAKGSLYPDRRIWEVLTLEATGDALCDAAVAMTYEARFKGTEGKSGEWIEAQWAKAARILASLEARWMSHLSGPVDAGQIAVACGLGYLDLRHAGRDWRATVPELAAWHARFAERPSMADTVPPEA
ncbi:glutathione S-transferase [Histidinibacterium aquaticum]|uniref:Glutathione S-transferase n=1 Tax=Histidinibacterium aquaticum TaxID=2613962 RepID=A0A5J5GEL7_9RHOB|nr:glutathione S-transferase [Histidinibacterium aquaticum]KAA9006659.1 glutathione S-transferase [Histidinibacterium aquaticum]